MPSQRKLNKLRQKLNKHSEALFRMDERINVDDFLDKVFNNTNLYSEIGLFEYTCINNIQCLTKDEINQFLTNDPKIEIINTVRNKIGFQTPYIVHNMVPHNISSPGMVYTFESCTKPENIYLAEHFHDFYKGTDLVSQALLNLQKDVYKPIKPLGASPNTQDILCSIQAQHISDIHYFKCNRTREIELGYTSTQVSMASLQWKPFEFGTMIDLLSNISSYSIDCGVSRRVILPKPQEDVLAIQFDPSTQLSAPSRGFKPGPKNRTPVKKRIRKKKDRPKLSAKTSQDARQETIRKRRGLGFSFEDGEYTYITNYNEKTNHLFQYIEIYNVNSNLTIRFITNQTRRNANTPEDACRITKTNLYPRRLEGEITKGYYINNDPIEGTELSSRGGWSILEIQNYISLIEQSKTPTGTLSDIINGILETHVHNYNTNQNKILIALEFKRLGDWGQIQNIILLNQTSPKKLFVTCDKIAGYQCITCNEPCLVANDTINEREGRRPYINTLLLYNVQGDDASRQKARCSYIRTKINTLRSNIVWVDDFNIDGRDALNVYTQTQTVKYITVLCESMIVILNNLPSNYDLNRNILSALLNIINYCELQYNLFSHTIILMKGYFQEQQSFQQQQAVGRVMRSMGLREMQLRTLYQNVSEHISKFASKSLFVNANLAVISSLRDKTIKIMYIWYYFVYSSVDTSATVFQPEQPDWLLNLKPDDIQIFMQRLEDSDGDVVMT